MLGLIFSFYSLVSFGKSFRVGIDEEHPGSLVTTGAFAISRNPIYTSFGAILIGIFLIFPKLGIINIFSSGLLALQSAGSSRGVFSKKRFMAKSMKNTAKKSADTFSI